MVVIIRILINSVLSVVLFCTCLMLSWYVWSSNNFLFSQLYEYNELEVQIDKYAPQNRYRHNFETTSKDERVRIFGQLVKAINNNGMGLEAIAYKANNGEIIDKFLTEPEINHLEDVSDFRKRIKIYASILTVFLVITVSICWVTKVRKAKSAWRPFSVGKSFVSILALLLICYSAVFAIGPQKVFYVLHEYFFADKAQWFFYFQESLMTTMLPEPLFGSIASLLVATAFGMWIILSKFIIIILR